MSKTFDRHIRNHVSNHQHSLQLLRSTRVYSPLKRKLEEPRCALFEKRNRTVLPPCCIAWKHNLSRIGENYTMRLAIAIFKPYGGESPSVSTNPTTGASSLWWASKKWRRRRCAAGPPSHRHSHTTYVVAPWPLAVMMANGIWWELSSSMYGFLSRCVFYDWAGIAAALLRVESRKMPLTNVLFYFEPYYTRIFSASRDHVDVGAPPAAPGRQKWNRR